MIALAGWGGLAAWQGLSSLWADEPTAATSAMSLTLLYAAAFGLVLVASNGAPTLRRLLELSLLLAVVVGVSSVGQRILPDVIPGHETGGRLATPISYWNTLALAFAFGLVLAIGIAGDATRGRVVRALCAATSPLFALGILFTQSRGSLLVAVVGVVLLIVVAPGRLITVWSALVAAVVSVPLMAYANDQTALRAENVLEQPHAGAGARVAIALLVAAAVAARPPPSTSRRCPRRSAPAGAAGSRASPWAASWSWCCWGCWSPARPRAAPCRGPTASTTPFAATTPARATTPTASRTASWWPPDRAAGRTGRWRSTSSRTRRSRAPARATTASAGTSTATST